MQMDHLEHIPPSAFIAEDILFNLWCEAGSVMGGSLLSEG